MTVIRGDASEGAIFGALIDLGCHVLIPFGQSQPYDLVVDRVGAGFVRIQCKTGWERNGCILFNSCSTDHGAGRQDYRGRADLFAVYFPPTRQVYVVPVEQAATRTSRLRLRPTANCQKSRVRHAEDHELRRWAPALVPPPLLRAV